MPMIWNAEADAKMFAAVIKTSENLSFQPAAIAALMGPDCTAKAVSHRITNLRKVAASLDPNDPGPTTATTTAATVAKINGTPKTPKTPGSTKKRVVSEVNGDGEDGTPTPAKKARTPRKKKGGKSEAVVKAEEIKEEEVENSEKEQATNVGDGVNGEGDVKKENEEEETLVNGKVEGAGVDDVEGDADTRSETGNA